MNLEIIKEKLENMLPEKRLKHSLNVAECAVELGEIYNCNKEKLYIAGLVHDCAKYLNEKEIDYYVNKYDIILDDMEKNDLALSHSTIGYYIVKNEFEIKDEEILSAVKYHTTGKINMNLMDKIIFIADTIEKDRVFPGVEELRNLTYNGDIDKAILKSFNNTIQFVINQNKIIHPRTVEARNYMLK